MTSHPSSASLITPNPSDLLVDRVNHAGILTLNRPHAHNAINHYMTLELGRQLRVCFSIEITTIAVLALKLFSVGSMMMPVLTRAM